MKRPLVVFGVALAAILAPSVPVRAQACASGQTLLKNDVLPVNPGMQSVSVITGLCEGEAAGCVFDFTSIATTVRVNSAGIGYIQAGGINGTTAAIGPTPIRTRFPNCVIVRIGPLITFNAESCGCSMPTVTSQG